jgi:tRNA pseudouridine55 synthase
MPLFGLLNINKPAGVTSRWVVDQVKRHVKPTPVGHAGTLDPLATGVLLICIGHATRLVEYIHELPKRYNARFLLGRSSPSDDVETEVTELRNSPHPTREALELAARQFIGAIGQRPPVYSAVKVKGRRAYDLARAGKLVHLVRKIVHVYELAIVDYAYPELTLELECSSGTYIRAVGRDLAEAVGSGAVMSSLTRTSIGRFEVATALDPRALTIETIREAVLPPLCAVDDQMSVCVVSDQDVERLRDGREIALPSAQPGLNAAVDAAGTLVAILVRGREGVYRPAKFFSQTR